MDKKRVIILGSTGSIGTQALDFISKNLELFEVVGLSAHKNIEALIKQSHEFKVNNIAVTGIIEGSSSIMSGPNCFFGADACEELIKNTEVDIVLNAVVGAAGLGPTIKTLEMGITLALANKESLVVGGEIVMPLAAKLEQKRAKPSIIPVDSEHSAVFQCLTGEKNTQVRNITLTASGGPFRLFSRERLDKVVPGDALNHPTWDMGNKVTIDSATLMNKGLEVIEAHHLFAVDYKNIGVVVHPQSIVHCLVTFVDDSVKSLLAYPDMRIPIAYSLTFPDRIVTKVDIPELDLAKTGSLEFFEPDVEKFKCLGYAFKAGQMGKTYPAVLSAANEIAVEAFLNNRIGFLGIADLVNTALENHEAESELSLESILAADKWARAFSSKQIESIER